MIKMFNLYGIIMMFLVMIPNIIYFQKNKNIEAKKFNKGTSLEISENILRYGMIIFFIINTGLFEYGFAGKYAVITWIISAIVMTAIYYVCWYGYFKNKSYKLEMLLSSVPSVLFIFTGIMMRRYAALVLAVLFAAVHIYATYMKNNKVNIKEKNK